MSPTTDPGRVDDPGKSLTRESFATTPGELRAVTAAQSGWLFSAERGGTLWVKVPKGEHGAVVGW